MMEERRLRRKEYDLYGRLSLQSVLVDATPDASADQSKRKSNCILTYRYDMSHRSAILKHRNPVNCLPYEVHLF